MEWTDDHLTLCNHMLHSRNIDIAKSTHSPYNNIGTQ